MAEASWPGGPGGRASGTARAAVSAQSVTWRLGEGSLAGAGRGGGESSRLPSEEGGLRQLPSPCM